jgi:hypothetical protein
LREVKAGFFRHEIETRSRYSQYEKASANDAKVSEFVNLASVSQFQSGDLLTDAIEQNSSADPFENLLLEEVGRTDGVWW